MGGGKNFDTYNGFGQNTSFLYRSLGKILLNVIVVFGVNCFVPETTDLKSFLTIHGCL